MFLGGCQSGIFQTPRYDNVSWCLPILTSSNDHDSISRSETSNWQLYSPVVIFWLSLSLVRHIYMWVHVCGRGVCVFWLWMYFFTWWICIRISMMILFIMLLNCCTVCYLDACMHWWTCLVCACGCVCVCVSYIDITLIICYIHLISNFDCWLLQFIYTFIGFFSNCWSHDVFKFSLLLISFTSLFCTSWFFIPFSAGHWFSSPKRKSHILVWVTVGGGTLGDLGLCCCVSCLSSTIISLHWVILHRHSRPHTVSEYNNSFWGQHVNVHTCVFICWAGFEIKGLCWSWIKTGSVIRMYTPVTECAWNGEYVCHWGQFFFFFFLRMYL